MPNIWLKAQLNLQECKCDSEEARKQLKPESANLEAWGCFGGIS